MKFSALLGISVGQVEDPEQPGVFKDKIEEIKVIGSLIREAQYPSRGELGGTIRNVSLQNRMDVIMDSRLKDKIFNIRYASFLGSKFYVTTIEVKRPHIHLTLGGVYNEFSE